MAVIDIERYSELSYRFQLFCLIFIGLAVLPPLFYFRQPLLHDEMTYLAIGREIASGGTLYAGIAGHKPPGSITWLPGSGRPSLNRTSVAVSWCMWPTRSRLDSVSSLGRPSRLTNQQWASLIAGVFVVLLVVGGTAGVNGRYLLLLSDDSIEDQAEDAEALATHVDGRFYALGPPTRYELAYFEDARPAQRFITAPYGEPLADRVIRTLERDQVEHVLVKRQQVVDGRIAADYTYDAGPRERVVTYIEANYEPTATTEDFVIYTRKADGGP